MLFFMCHSQFYMCLDDVLFGCRVVLTSPMHVSFISSWCVVEFFLPRNGVMTKSETPPPPKGGRHKESRSGVRSLDGGWIKPIFIIVLIPGAKCQNLSTSHGGAMCLGVHRWRFIFVMFFMDLKPKESHFLSCFTPMSRILFCLLTNGA